MTIASPRSPAHPVALLLVDVINDFEFPEGEALHALAGKAVNAATTDSAQLRLDALRGGD